MTKNGIALVGRLSGLGARVWLGYAPLVGLVLAYYALAVLALDDFDAQVSFDLVQAFMNARLMVLTFVLAGALFGYASLLRQREARPWPAIGAWMRRTPFIEIVLVRFLPVVLLLVPLQEAYLAVKREIPAIAPYSWDAALAELDRLLFLGTDPWRLTHALVPWPAGTWALDMAYVLWFYLLMACIAAAGVLRLESRLRMTFLLTCFLTWSLGGSLLAVIFSSAGPVYMEPLFGDATFAPLVERLAAQDQSWRVLALTAQESLWQGYSDPAVPAMGISAFPSMHLCASAGMMLFGFRLARALGCALAAFTFVMLVASVHLGWHYAVDGIAGIGLAFAFWWVAGRFSDWWFERATLPLSAPEPGAA